VDDGCLIGLWVFVKCLLGFGLLDSEVQMLDVDMEADGKVQQTFCGHHGI